MRRARRPALLLAALAALAGASCTPGVGLGRDRAVYRAPSSSNVPSRTDEAAAAAAAAAASGEPGVDKSDLAGLPPPSRIVGSGARPVENDRRSRRRIEEEKNEDEFYADKVEAARAAIDRADDEMAAQILDAALELHPREPWGDRLRTMRQEIRVRRLETEVLRADVRGVRDYVPFESDVDLIVRIRNVGSAEVTIEAPSGSGKDALSGSILVLSISQRDRDVYAAEFGRTWTRTLPLLEAGACGIRIPPEGAYEMRVRVPAEDAGPPLSGLRVLEVGGDLRAGQIRAGLSEPIGRIRIRPGRVVVLPRNFEPLAADPIGSMRKAASAVAPVHLLVAAEFVAPADRPAAVAILADVLAAGSVDLNATALNTLHLLRVAAAGQPVRPLAAPLVEALRAHPERARDLMLGLRAMTGVSLAPDPRLWEDWWRRESSGPSAVVPSDEDLSAPGDKPKRR